MRAEDGVRVVDPNRARSIRFQVERVLGLFDAVECATVRPAQLASELDAPEGLVEWRSDAWCEGVPSLA